MFVRFGREICGDPEAASRREWLVTNGIGGYTAGTVSGTLTRKYHGLLIAALQPPVGRTLLVSKIDETAAYDGHEYALGTNRWAGGAVDPRGFEHIERFGLDGLVPVWTFAAGDALIEKRVWMRQGSNTTFVRYRVLRARRPVGLRLRLFVNHRDYHGTTSAGDWRFQTRPVQGGLRVDAFGGATPFYLLSSAGRLAPDHTWYRNFDLAVERYRGLPDREDHLSIGTVEVELEPGRDAIIVASTEPDTAVEDAQRPPTILHAAPEWIGQLALTAQQFIVARPLPDDPGGMSVIAGYPWFGDWGRDTMIALPGLTLTTSRPEVARKILLTSARFMDQGMLPNRFPDSGEQPEYNTADASLWYFEAVRRYIEATRDPRFPEQIFPTLEEIVHRHVHGTRYGIRVDESDGLLYAGEPGVQLTWMDAKVGDWVVTPRIGKPVELNALWLNALEVMAALARGLGRPDTEYECLAMSARAGFGKFWKAKTGYCHDVIDGPDGPESGLRPNQILAVSLPIDALDRAQQKAVVDACARRLLTSFGLRSLAPGEPAYVGRYGGGRVERDAAYHQGTVWAWLIGPFVDAHLRVYRDAEATASFLDPFADHLRDAGLGSISEIFDGEAPFASRGCFSQAWSVAEVLRAWAAVRDFQNQP